MHRIFNGKFCFRVGREVVVQIDEKEVNGFACRDTVVKFGFVQPERFPNKAFHPVPLYRALEFLLADADGDACRKLTGQGRFFEDNPERVFHKAAFGSQQFIEQFLAA